MQVMPMQTGGHIATALSGVSIHNSRVSGSAAMKPLTSLRCNSSTPTNIDVVSSKQSQYQNEQEIKELQLSRERLQKVTAKLAHQLHTQVREIAQQEVTNRWLANRLKQAKKDEMIKCTPRKRPTLKKTKYFATIDFKNHYPFGQHYSISTASYSSVPAIIQEILSRIQECEWKERKRCIFEYMESKHVQNLSLWRRASPPKFVMTSLANPQASYVVRADRRHHFSAFYKGVSGAQGILRQLGLCPHLVCISTETTSGCENDICSSSSLQCICSTSTNTPHNNIEECTQKKVDDNNEDDDDDDESSSLGLSPPPLARVNMQSAMPAKRTRVNKLKKRGSVKERILKKLKR